MKIPGQELKNQVTDYSTGVEHVCSQASSTPSSAWALSQPPQTLEPEPYTSPKSALTPNLKLPSGSRPGLYAQVKVVPLAKVASRHISANPAPGSDLRTYPHAFRCQSRPLQDSNREPRHRCHRQAHLFDTCIKWLVRDFSLLKLENYGSEK